MNATFDIDEGTMLRIQRLVREGKVSSATKNHSDVTGLQILAAGAVAAFEAPGRASLPNRLVALQQFTPAANAYSIPVYLGTADEKGFPHEGSLNFLDNRVDPTTGTLRARASFPNPRVNANGESDANGQRVLTPGLFVRIRVPVGSPYKALLVTDRALLSDQ